MGTVSRRLRHTLPGLVACLALVAGTLAAEPLEYAVKAAYLVKFPFYVEWPASAFANPGAPLVLCVIGEDPFGSLLDEAAAGQQVQGRSLVLRRLKTAPRDASCHVAYLGADVRPDVLRGSGMLVITDARAEGGMIHFVVKDNRVRFTVDDEAAAQGGLTISSKLLNVALAVKARGAR
jgi:hypothetical protein